jgi:RNA polymerase sigma-70 factor (ECF subfamily)
MDPLEVVKALQATTTPDPADEADIEQQVEALGDKLEAYSPRAYAALIMYRCEGLTFAEIGKRLGVSAVMARKYLARAIAFCDQTLDAPRGRDP